MQCFFASAFQALPSVFIAIVLLGLSPQALAPAMATEPSVPVEIITPEARAESGRITTDQLEIHITEGAVKEYKATIELLRAGVRVLQQPLELKVERTRLDSDEKQPADAPGILVARLAAVPEEIWRKVEPGVYAHKVRVEAVLVEGEGPLVVEDWVRWRTDGKTVEYLTIETYSALTEETESSVDALGRKVVVFTGRDVKLEREEKSEKVEFDTRVDEGGIRPEVQEELRTFELKNQLDESKED